MCHGILPVVIVSSVCAGICLAQEAVQLNDEADRINYTIGRQIGTDFKRQGVGPDAAMILRGVEHALTGVEPALSREEMRRLLVALKRKITADIRAEAMARLEVKQKDAAEKRRQGQAFLLAKRDQAGVKTMPSGLQYRVIEAGHGPRPTAVDKVSIHYRARQLSGREFNSSYRKGGPATFRVDGVIPGFSEALQMMPTGAKWELYLPPELAYGRQGPLAHQTIIIEAELLAIGQEAEVQGDAEPQARQADTTWKARTIRR